jgi:PPOX class probable F420-dependent enzyme
MKNIPQSHQDLLKDETKANAYIATTMADGTPQVSPIWFNFDGENILVNTAEGRLKAKNMRQRPYAAITLVDPKDPYRYLLVRGPVVEVTQQGAEAHIHALSQKYRGKDWDIPAGQLRLKCKIKPEHVFADQ